jgi:uncharacterized protein (DUF2345 family)
MVGSNCLFTFIQAFQISNLIREYSEVVGALAGNNSANNQQQQLYNLQQQQQQQYPLHQQNQQMSNGYGQQQQFQSKSPSLPPMQTPLIVNDMTSTANL